MRRRLGQWSDGREVGRRELQLLALLVVIGLVLRVVYVLLTKDHSLGVDEADYDEAGRFATDGRWFWFTPPYGVPHASMWKAPVYPAWIGIVYTVTGGGAGTLVLLQTLLGPLVIVLTWLLARRLFGSRAALAAAALAAVYPHMWQWEATLHPEALALPLSLLFYLAVLGRQPTPRRVFTAGVLLGVLLLVRPTSGVIVALPAVAWWITAGFRRGVGATAVTACVGVLVVAPWTVHNLIVHDAFVPISVQDAAVSGTFNDDAANDGDHPWAWRVYVARDRDIFRKPRPEATFRRQLQRRAIDYVLDHPTSVPKAFFWNGVLRTWDLTTPSEVLDQTRYDGRVRWVEGVALAMYWPLLVLALIGLWRQRHRRELVWPVMGLALLSSVVFTIAAASRYRVPLEPLVVIFACSLLAPPWRREPQPPSSSP